MESVVAEIVGVLVRECWDRPDGPWCCVEIQPSSRRPTRDRRTAGSVIHAEPREEERM